MTTLLIDTSRREKISVGIKQKNKNFNKELTLDVSRSGQKSSQVLLPLIIQILKENKLTLKDIDEIKVNMGPGSFTGLRVGVSVANALSFTLNIPVNGKHAKTQLVEPVYI